MLCAQRPVGFEAHMGRVSKRSRVRLSGRDVRNVGVPGRRDSHFELGNRDEMATEVASAGKHSHPCKAVEILVVVRFGEVSPVRKHCRPPANPTFFANRHWMAAPRWKAAGSAVPVGSPRRPWRSWRRPRE